MRAFLKRVENRPFVIAFAMWCLLASHVGFLNCCTVLLDWMQLLPLDMDMNGKSHAIEVAQSVLLWIGFGWAGLLLLRTAARIPKTPSGGQEQ